MGIIINIQSFHNMKFAVIATLAAAVSAGATFDGLDFLQGPKEMKEAEAARARFIAEHMKLAKARAIATHHYFKAKDEAATAARWMKIFHGRAMKAGSFKNLMIAFHAKATKHHAAMKAKRDAAWTKWLAARKAHRAARKARKAAATAYAMAIKVRVAAQKHEATRKAALAAAWKTEKSAGKVRAATREVYVKWAKAHRSALSKMQKAALKKMASIKAHKKAVATHKKSVAKHTKAVDKRTAALKAAIKAHKAVHAHAAKGIKLVL